MALFTPGNTCVINHPSIYHCFWAHVVTYIFPGAGRATTLVPCYPIRTFQADDLVVHTLKRGDVVRELEQWPDSDKRHKIQHSRRKFNREARPLWSLQPDHEDDSDKYAHIAIEMPSFLNGIS